MGRSRSALPERARDHGVMNGVLVSVSGVDLAGKTTQLELLERWLMAEGLRATRLWHRPGYSPALDGLRRAVRRIRPSALPPPGPSASRAEVFQRPSVRAAWITMALADSVAHYGLRVRAALRCHDVVLCDRYVADAVLDFRFRFGERAADLMRRTLHPVAPIPHAALLLVLSWDEVLRRLSVKDEPFPEPMDARRLRYHAYQELAARGEHVVVDATPPANVVQEVLRQRIREARA